LLPIIMAYHNASRNINNHIMFILQINETIPFCEMNAKNCSMLWRSQTGFWHNYDEQWQGWITNKITTVQCYESNFQCAQLSALQEGKHTFAMSQAITFGSLETRSIEKTLFFTLLAMSASPRIETLRH